MYNFTWTSVFLILTKVKESLGIPCVYMSSTIPWTYRVNGKCNMPKRLESWDEMQWRVKMCGHVGGTGLRLTSALICKMSKREGKLCDKDLKDNVCCLDHGVLKIITLILPEVFMIQNMLFCQSPVTGARWKCSKIWIKVLLKPTQKCNENNNKTLFTTNWKKPNHPPSKNINNKFQIWN